MGGIVLPDYMHYSLTHDAWRSPTSHVSHLTPTALQGNSLILPYLLLPFCDFTL